MTERILHRHPSPEYRRFMELNPGFLPGYTAKLNGNKSLVQAETNYGYFVVPTEGYALFGFISSARMIGDTNEHHLRSIVPDEVVLDDDASSEYWLLKSLLESRFEARDPKLPMFRFADHDYGTCDEAETKLFSAFRALYRSEPIDKRRLEDTPLTIFVDENLVPIFYKKYRTEHTGIALRPFYSNTLLYPQGTLVSVYTQGEIDRVDEYHGERYRTVDSEGLEHILYDGETDDGRRVRIIGSQAIWTVDPTRLTPWAHEDLRDRELFAVRSTLPDGTNEIADIRKVMLQAPLEEHRAKIDAFVKQKLGAKL